MILKEFLGENIVFIPIRGGSKSIPLKNIKLINGKPLVYWVLRAAEKCSVVDKIVVSTDSNIIFDVVSNFNFSKVLIISRSENVSTDFSSTESVMLEFAENYLFTNIILVQATSPLLTSIDLENGVNKFNKEDFDSILSVVRQKRFIWKENGSLVEASNYIPIKRPRRQDFDGFLVENGAFYITSRERLLLEKCRISGKIGAVEMCEESYFEIDEPSDWIIIENLLKEKFFSNNFPNLEKIRCLLVDCDGVLTDGGMYYSEKGDELKKFNTKDGMGFKLLQNKGYITGIITGEKINLVKTRGAKMRLHEVFVGIENKMKIINIICEKYNLTLNEIAYIGDDINDLDVIKNVGFGCTVENGIPELKKNADYITKVKGGEGAVREVIDILLNA